MVKKTLLKSLNDWTAAGIITGAQKDTIISFEEKKSGGARSRWALYGFLVLGVSIIGIGLISIIAANWEEIPGGIKLFMDFILLMAVAAGVLALDLKERGILYDAAASFFALFVLASIGLISQVFHTGGELHQALFFWAAIIFPLSLFTKKGFIPYLWVAGFLGATVAWATSEAFIWSEYTNDDEVILALGMALPFLCLFAGSLMSRAKVLGRHSTAFIQWALVFMLGAIIITDINISTDEFDVPARIMLPAAVFACLALASVIADFKVRVKEKAIILAMTAITALPYIPLLFPPDPEAIRTGNEFLGALYTISMLILLSMLFVVRDSKRLFNVATLLAGLRFLVVYFQVFKDLAATGFGLIFSGLLIIGVSLLWFRQRDRLLRLLRSVIGDKDNGDTE